VVNITKTLIGIDCTYSGAGDREIDLLVATAAAAPDAPQRRDKKTVSCRLLNASYLLLS
jgi:hypothetical protein